MTVIDFSRIEDVNDFTPLPEGQYLSRVDDVGITTTKSGDEMWRLRFVVEEGEYAGRYIFDKLVFSDAALTRVKLICSRLGLDVSGKVELTPELIEGCTCVISVQIEDYEDNEGETKTRNIVPFKGYDYSDDQLAETADDSRPF